MCACAAFFYHLEREKRNSNRKGGVRYGKEKTSKRQVFCGTNCNICSDGWLRKCIIMVPDVTAGGVLVMAGGIVVVGIGVMVVVTEDNARVDAGVDEGDEVDVDVGVE